MHKSTHALNINAMTLNAWIPMGEHRYACNYMRKVGYSQPQKEIDLEALGSALKTL